MIHCNLNFLYLDIINCVKVANTPYFRPEIPLESPANRIRDLLEKCWDENPDQRPSFSAVQGMFKRAVGGDEGSVANTMMRRLELYAQELEDIVHERTKVLLAEQAKAITILHQLLPPYVNLVHYTKSKYTKHFANVIR